MDVSNAFKTIHRAAVLRAVRVQFPSLSPWVDCCYRRESTLFTGSNSAALQVIPSSRVSNRATHLVRFSSLWRHTPPSSRQGQLRRHRSPEASTCAPSTWMTAFAAGSAPAVRCFLSAFRAGFHSIGLVVNLDKTKVIPACRSAQSFNRSDFQGCSWNGAGCFKLLGAPIGSTEWCEELLGRRIAKARSLLTAIGKFPDAQGAFCLLRSCSGWSKVLYSCRTVPPDAQSVGLRTPDSDLRAALGQLIGRPLSGDDLLLSALLQAGLGQGVPRNMLQLRDVAGFSACWDTCCLLWPAFDPFDLDEGCPLAAAEEALRRSVPSGADIYADSESPTQKFLSGMIEAQSSIFSDPSLPKHRRLHLEACPSGPPLPDRSPAPSGFGHMGSRHRLWHVRRSSGSMGRPCRLLLLWW